MGTTIGILKTAAKRLGLSFENYMEKRNRGLKWCYKCQSWKSQSQFNKDKSRGDGLKAICASCDRVKTRKKRKLRAPSRKTQSKATSAVSYAIKTGHIPHISTQSCVGCGDQAEVYHHHKGYNKKH